MLNLTVRWARTSLAALLDKTARKLMPPDIEPARTFGLHVVHDGHGYTTTAVSSSPAYLTWETP